ncbi:MAG TPA: DUF2163 domain-containing protein [Rubrivivax sp.]|nr:DUF2163 domain-containing protein [Rubrivivax sp.]
MITVTPQLANFMDTGTVARRFDLLTLTLASGQVLRYTNADQAIALPDARAFAVGPLIVRGRLALKRGLEVDRLSLTLIPRPVDQLGGVPLLQAARAGALAGCRVLLEWAYFDAANAYQGVMPRFVGTGSPVGLEAGTIELEVRSELERLQQQMPRDVYQPRCLNQVFDAGCGKDRTAFRISGLVAGIPAPTRSSFATNVDTTAGYFELGVIRFTSGANAGISRTVRSYSSRVFTFARPFPFDILPADAFYAEPGCDGTISTCTTRYANLPRFRGQPFIPAAETTT